MQRWQARTLNVMNLLGLVLFLLGVGLAVAGGTGSVPREMARFLGQTGIVLVGVAIVMRIAWGLATRKLRRAMREKKRRGIR